VVQSEKVEAMTQRMLRRWGGGEGDTEQGNVPKARWSAMSCDNNNMRRGGGGWEQPTQASCGARTKRHQIGFNPN
jgi:hypothetical protein